MTDVSLCVQIACLWEVTARKPGNVHRYRDCADVQYTDFLLSSAAIAPVLRRAQSQPVGQTILQAVQATRAVTGTNTNLGIILLLTPLAAVSDGEDLRPGVERVLSTLTLDDSRNVYAAIRLARPGGMGTSAEQDLANEPTLPLREIMALATERDLIAQQYANGCREVFDEGVPTLARGLREAGSLEGAIVAAFLELLAQHPDSLIARKRGMAEAKEVSRRARQVREGGLALHDFDEWLRAEAHGRNPGTAADLVTACLFVALRTGMIQLPPQLPWAAQEWFA